MRVIRLSRPAAVSSTSAPSNPYVLLFGFRKSHRQQIIQDGLGIASVGQRIAPAQQQQAAAAAIDELLNQLMLRRSSNTPASTLPKISASNSNNSCTLVGKPFTRFVFDPDR